MRLNIINRQIFKLAIPSIFANITVPLVGIVDLAIAGHIGNATTMSGIVIGTMLFDLLYWNMGFLRVGTGGVAAQAYGRGDMRGAMSAFTQGIFTAITISASILAIQWLFIWGAFLVVDCSAEVETLAREYFAIRVWAVPASLSLMVFRGWFIGMQNTLLPMILDIYANISNAIVSYIFAVNFEMGIAGVAYGTLFAQYSALLLATILMSIKFYNLYGLIDLKKSIKWQYIKGYFAMNGNLFARSLLMLVVYAGFTLFATKYGDVELAVSNLMMKLLLLYSYFTDGFAYAAEALTGKYIGAQKGKMLQMTIKWVFVWSIIIGIISTIIYAIWGAEMVKIFTDDPDVIKTSHKYLFWLIPMPLISCIAFTWDGIYIGATASAALRNCMVWSAALFVATLLIFKSIIEIQALYLAYFMHLFVRSVYQTIKYKHYVKIDKSRYPTEK